MEYLIGSKQEFLDFLSSIKPEDKVGILTHIDLDGIMSSLFIEKALKRDPDYLGFLQYKDGMFEVPISQMKEKGITKLFITDVYADGTDLEGFSKLKQEFDVFLIDHHPVVQGFNETKNVIKTQSADCCTIVLYDLLKDFIGEEWKGIICATLISEFSFKNPENLKFIQSVFPEVTLENIRDSGPAKLSNKIGGALIYTQKEKDGINKIYDLVKQQDFEKLGEYNHIIEQEVTKWLHKFEQDAEFYPEKNLYYFYATPNFNVTSVLSTIVSVNHVGKSVVLVAPIESDKDYVKISARNQGKDEDMSALLKKGIEGLENSNAGGHKPAAGGRLMKKDLDKFKENLLK